MYSIIPTATEVPIRLHRSGNENFFRFSRKLLVFAKVFWKIFYSECGFGFRSHLNVYPDPNHFWKIFAKTTNFRENENFRENFRETKFREISRKVSDFSLIFAFRENEKRVFVATLDRRFFKIVLRCRNQGWSCINFYCWSQSRLKMF
jgi:hypothetical protein